MPGSLKSSYWKCHTTHKILGKMVRHTNRNVKDGHAKTAKNAAGCKKSRGGHFVDMMCHDEMANLTEHTDKI